MSEVSIGLVRLYFKVHRDEGRAGEQGRREHHGVVTSFVLVYGWSQARTCLKSYVSMNEGELEFVRTVMRAEQASRVDESTTGWLEAVASTVSLRLERVEGRTCL